MATTSTESDRFDSTGRDVARDGQPASHVGLPATASAATKQPVLVDEAEQQRKRKRDPESPTRQKSLKISKSLLARFQQMLDPETLLLIQEVASGARTVSFAH